MIVQIIAGHSIELFPDGVTRTAYDDGQLYDVRPHIADSMIVRGWAKLVTVDLASSQEAQPRTSDPESAEGSKPRRR